MHPSASPSSLSPAADPARSPASPPHGHATHTGQVKWFDPKKGYGFIIGPQGQDVFVHYSQIDGDGFKSLDDGESVSYHIEQGAKGFLARGVQRSA